MNYFSWKWHSCQPGSHLNIAIGPLIQTWRIGFSDAKLPLPEEIVHSWTSSIPMPFFYPKENQSVFLKEKGMKIDLGALAKGYIADRIADFLKAKKVTSALINLGGNVLTFGPASIIQTTNGELVFKILRRQETQILWCLL